MSCLAGWQRARAHKSRWMLPLSARLFGCRFAARSFGPQGNFLDAIDSLLDPPHVTKNLINRLSELINHLQCSAFVAHRAFSWRLTASVSNFLKLERKLMRVLGRA